MLLIIVQGKANTIPNTSKQKPMEFYDAGNRNAFSALPSYSTYYPSCL